MKGGFTVIEIVIMLAILTFISAILLTSVPGFNEERALVRAQQELALNFRRVQNIALSVAQVTLPDGSKAAPTRIGVHFNSAKLGEYFYFIDSDGNNIYKDPPDDECCPDKKLEPVFTFQQGIRFNPDGAFYNQLGGAESVVNVLFTAPEAKIGIYKPSGSAWADIGGSVCLELKTPNLGLRRAVRVRTSGQVALEKSCQ